MAITLARALKYKNRLAEQIRKVEQNVCTFNSMIAGGEREIDCNGSMEEREGLVTNLVDLKLKIDAANEPIKARIFTLQELKGKIAFLSRIPTQHGKTVSQFYREEADITYEAVIRKKEIDDLTKVLEREVDTIQEQLDQHNNVTTIDVEVLF
jgi:hypothetical protein